MKNIVSVEDNPMVSVATPNNKIIKIGDIEIMVDQRKVLVGDQKISVNRRQFDILSYFAPRAERVVSREELIHAIDRDGEMFDRTIDVHICQLRSILKKYGVGTISINAVYGIGYRLEIEKKV